MKTKKRMSTVFTVVLCSIAAVCCAGSVLALDEGAREMPELTETIFLGEAVPLRLESCGNVSLEELLRRDGFQGEDGGMEIWWMGPDGREPIESLSRLRPKTSASYQLTAVLHGKDKDRWLSAEYQVQVVSGSVRVAVDGPGAVAGASVLFRLEGRGLTLYAQASMDPDPMGGAALLLAEFSGLPYGEYTVTPVSGKLAPEQVSCWLGACPDNDTVDPDRRAAVASFSLDSAGGEAAGESYRLRDAA